MAADPKLTGKRAAYVRLVLSGHTPSAAGLGAGLTTAQVAQLEADPTVRAHVRVGRLREVDDAAILLFWAHTMQDDEADLQQRLKASELLAKSRGMLKDKVEHTGQVTLVDLVLAAGKKS